MIAGHDGYGYGSRELAVEAFLKIEKELEPRDQLVFLPRIRNIAGYGQENRFRVGNSRMYGRR